MVPQSGRLGKATTMTEQPTRYGQEPLSAQVRFGRDTRRCQLTTRRDRRIASPHCWRCSRSAIVQRHWWTITVEVEPFRREGSRYFHAAELRNADGDAVLPKRYQLPKPQQPPNDLSANRGGS